MSDVKYDEMLVHIKSGSIIPLQLTDFEKTEKDTTRDYSAYQNKVIKENEEYSIETLKNQFLDLVVMFDIGYHAKGWVRFDNGETKNLSLYTEFSFEAKGVISLNETSSINVTVNVTKYNSTLTDINNQKFGSILIYIVKKLNISKDSKFSIDLSNTQKIEAEPM